MTSSCKKLDFYTTFYYDLGLIMACSIKILPTLLGRPMAYPSTETKKRVAWSYCQIFYTIKYFKRKVQVILTNHTRAVIGRFFVLDNIYRRILHGFYLLISLPRIACNNMLCLSTAWTWSSSRRRLCCWKYVNLSSSRLQLIRNNRLQQTVPSYIKHYLTSMRVSNQQHVIFIFPFC